MLILTRKIKEGIAIGEDIKIVVIDVKGKQVRLGVKAPDSVSVHREEVYEKILEENTEAAKSSLPLTGSKVASLIENDVDVGKTPIIKKK